MNEQHDVHDDMDLINVIDAVMKVAKPNGHDSVDNILAMTAALCRFWALDAKPTPSPEEIKQYICDCIDALAEHHPQLFLPERQPGEHKH